MGTDAYVRQERYLLVHISKGSLLNNTFKIAQHPSEVADAAYVSKQMYSL
jgi:hypothetical protein